MLRRPFGLFLERSSEPGECWCHYYYVVDHDRATRSRQRLEHQGCPYHRLHVWPKA